MPGSQDHSCTRVVAAVKQNPGLALCTICAPTANGTEQRAGLCATQRPLPLAQCYIVYGSALILQNCKLGLDISTIAHRHVLTGLDWLEAHEGDLHGEDGPQRVYLWGGRDLLKALQGVEQATPNQPHLPWNRQCRSGERNAR